MRTSQLCPLAGLPILDGVSRRQRRSIAHLGTTLDFGAGATLSREGDLCGELIVLVRGVVALTRAGARQGLMRAGDSWGDGGLFTTTTEMTAVAARPVRIHVYNERETRALRRACPLLAHRLLRTGAYRGVGQAAICNPPQAPVRAYLDLTRDGHDAPAAHDPRLVQLTADSSR